MKKKNKHEPRTKKQELVYQSFMIVVGTLLMSISFVLFIEYSGYVVGGVGGVALVFESFFPGLIATSDLITILMWTLFVLGWILVGTKFALKTLPATILYPVFIKMTEALINNPNIYIQGQTLMQTFESLNPIMCVVFGGVIYGMGAGMIFSVGGSSGGLDIPAAIFNKYFHIKLDVILFLQDAVVISLGIVHLGLEPALLGITMTYIMTRLVNRVMMGNDENMMVYIISSKYEEINQFILKQLDRGTTLIPCKGGFTGSDRIEIQVVIDKVDFVKLQKYIREVDGDCFMSVLKARDVLGQGFKDVRKVGQYE